MKRIKRMYQELSENQDFLIENLGIIADHNSFEVVKQKDSEVQIVYFDWELFDVSGSPSDNEWFEKIVHHLFLKNLQIPFIKFNKQYYFIDFIFDENLSWKKLTEEEFEILKEDFRKNHENKVLYHMKTLNPLFWIH
ncbi:hypothetical protein [Spiroplasma endosymbiont of Amphibalanus improvisus]|uniref:hypothetical protein n=1 Tax=Spiroplasma endosymbiont of Amphibalanus improvisus TaxID=3066327 RepID=UPI00313CB18F